MVARLRWLSLPIVFVASISYAEPDSGGFSFFGYTVEDIKSYFSDDGKYEGTAPSDTFSAVLSSDKLYKWQDNDGNWQFSTDKPEGISNYEVIDMPEIKGNTTPSLNKDQINQALSGISSLDEAVANVRINTTDQDRGFCDGYSIPSDPLDVIDMDPFAFGASGMICLLKAKVGAMLTLVAKRNDKISEL